MARRNENGLLEVFTDLFISIPTWTCVPIAVLAYGIIIVGAGIFATAIPAMKLVAALAPMFAGIFALLILLAGFTATIKKWKRRKLLAKQTGIESIRRLSWSQFELLVGEAYRRQGYSVEETGGGGADGGIDLKLHRNGAVTLVQCKHWKTWKVGVPSIREFYGVLMAEHADRGVFITSGIFTEEARRFASGKPLELIAGEELALLVRLGETAEPASASTHYPQSPTKADSSYAPLYQKAIARDVLTPPIQLAKIAAPVRASAYAPPAPTSVTDSPSPSCPKCGHAMLRRTAKRGVNAGSEFWGCSTYPACKGIRND